MMPPISLTKQQPAGGLDKLLTPSFPSLDLLQPSTLLPQPKQATVFDLYKPTVDCGEVFGDIEDLDLDKLQMPMLPIR